MAHDLGHPPFGHIAEDELDDASHEWGGFEGNAQSFRIVCELARRDRIAGLNLTWYTLNGLLKYPWSREGPKDESIATGGKWGVYESERLTFRWARERAPVPDDVQTLEAEIMDWADDVTYAVHDVDDFHRSGLVPVERLISDNKERARFVRSLFEANDENVPREKFRLSGLSKGDLQEAVFFLFDALMPGIGRYDGTAFQRVLLRQFGSTAITRYIKAFSVQPEPVRRGAGPPSFVTIEDHARAEVAVLKELVWFYVIRSPSLATVQTGQRLVIRELHDIYVAAVESTSEKKRAVLPTPQREQLELLEGGGSQDVDPRRLATDLVAGMTEDLAFELHGRLTGTTRGSILDAAASSLR